MFLYGIRVSGRAVVRLLVFFRLNGTLQGTGLRAEIRKYCSNPGIVGLCSTLLEHAGREAESFAA